MIRVGALDRITGAAGMVTDVTEARGDRIGELEEQLRAEQESNLLLEESMVDLELALEDAGWQRLGVNAAHEFSRAGLRRSAQVARIMVTANPLIRRGVNLRIAYVWGGGVTIVARAAGDDGGQDVNAVVQAFLDDDGNRAALTSNQAHEESERALGTDGNRFIACFTNPRTGRVQARTIPADEVEDVITNPEDRDDPWFYLRQWTAQVVEPGSAGGTRTRKETRRALYPALRHRPAIRPRSIDGIPVQWDAPVKHVSVNRLDGWKFGIGDAYSAISWARGYKEFLEDWARLVKALSRFAWRATGDKRGKAQAMAARARQAASTSTTGQPNDVGATAVMGPGQHLEAIPKSGATIDSQSGKPLAAMIAAGLDVPLTMLLADPGVTGARATAETLDHPTELMAGMRRTLWADTLRDILGYVIDQAVKAPAGPLSGTIRRDDNGREVIELAGDTPRTIDVDWPDLTETSLDTLMAAVEKADGIGKLPPLLIVKLILQALKVKDPDEWIEQVTDDDGNFIDPGASAGQAAVDAFRRGQDPAEALR